MCVANFLCSEGETSPYNIYKFSGNLLDINGDGIPEILQTDENKNTLKVTSATKTANGSIGFDRSFEIEGVASLSKAENTTTTYGAPQSITGAVRNLVTHDRKGNLIPKSKPNPSSVGGGVSYSTAQGMQKSGFYDINADGLIDYYDGYEFKLGNGTGFVRLEDKFINGILPGKTESNSFSINLNLGYGPDLLNNASLHSSASLNAGVSYISSSDTTDRMLADINGDGLIDLVYLTPGSTTAKVKYNRGSSFTDEKEIEFPLWGDIVSNNSLSFLTLGDNDKFDLGFLESIMPKEISQGLADALINPFGLDATNKANSLAWNESITIAGDANIGASVHITIPVFFAVVAHVMSTAGVSGNGSSTINTANVGMKDIDGDGFIDHIMRIPGVATYYKRNITGDYGLLNKITLPQGGSINLEYKEMKGTEDDPHFKRVLSKVEYCDNCAENGLKDIEHGAHKIVTAFDYENSFYDRDIKESYGFEKVYTYTGFDEESETFISQRIDTYYNRDYYSKGMLAESKVLDENGFMLSRAFNQIDDAPYALVLREDSFKYEVESGSNDYIYTYNTYEYDEFGNATAIYQNFADGKKINAVIYYNNQNLDDYILGLAEEINVYNTRGDLLRKKEGLYDDKGMMTDLFEYYDLNKSSHSQIEYDEYGNISKVIDTAGIIKEFVYDDVLNMLPVEIRTISSDSSDRLTSIIEYDYKTQTKSKETDPNGNFFIYTYDSWNRLKTLRTAYDSEYGTPAVEYSYFAEKK